MPSRTQRATSAALDETAILIEGDDGLRVLALLVRAIDHANLWQEVAWEPDEARADAHRAVARVRRALETVRGRVGQ